MNDEQLDKLFKKGLTDFEVDPGAEMWAKIEAELPAEPKIIPLWKRQGLRYVAALIILGGFAAIIFLQRSEEAPQKLQQIAQTGAQQGRIETTEKQQQVAEAPNESPLAQQAEATKVDKRPKQVSQPTVAVAQVIEAKGSTPKLDLQIPELQVATIEAGRTDTFPPTLVSTQVVEVDPIRPLIENPEEEESMLANAPKAPAKVQQGIVTGILNRISDVVNPDDSKTIHFSNDEEGSLRIDIFNSLVKNRNKIRR